MVDLAEIQAAYYMVAATGVLVAAAYYVMNIRTTHRNMKTTLDTRQAQLYMAIYQDLTSTETIDKFIKILNMQFKDFDEYERKYGSDNNPDFFTTRYSYVQKMNSIGWLVKQGLIDKMWIYEIYGWNIIWTWKKMEFVTKETEKHYGVFGSSDWFEYLYNEMKKGSDGREERSIRVPETFSQYIPLKPKPP
jgi:hypothetical protein